MDATSAVTELVGTAKLEVDIVRTEEMEEVVALNKGVAEFGIADAGTAFADAFLDELAIEELGHTEGFADFAQEWQEFDVFEPIVVIYELGTFWRVGDFDDLLGESDFILLDFVETFKVALDGVLRVANLTSSAADKIVRSIAVTNEACAHH